MAAAPATWGVALDVPPSGRSRGTPGAENEVMSLPTAEMCPPRLESEVRHSGTTAPSAGSDEVVFSTTIVFVSGAGSPAGAVSAAALNAAPRAAAVSPSRLG